jgi:hypothetical protein
MHQLLQIGRILLCGGPGCSDSFRRFLSESSVLGWATGVSGGRLMLTGAALVPCPSFD